MNFNKTNENVLYITLEKNRLKTNLEEFKSDHKHFAK